MRAYEPMWEKLKSKKTAIAKITIQVTIAQSRSTPLTLKELKEHARKIRRALSKEKQQDLEYTKENPRTRIEVDSMDTTTGTITFKLINFNIGV